MNPYKVQLENRIGIETNPEPAYYTETLNITPNAAENALFSVNPFSSFNELLDLDSLIE